MVLLVLVGITYLFVVSPQVAGCWLFQNDLQRVPGKSRNMHILARPRLKTGMLLLLPHCINSDKSQSQQDSETGNGFHI